MSHYVIELVAISDLGFEAHQIAYISSQPNDTSQQIQALKLRFEQEGWEFEEASPHLQGENCMAYFQSTNSLELSVFGEVGEIQLILTVYPDQKLMSLEAWLEEEAN